jgi:esterase/lipase
MTPVDAPVRRHRVRNALLIVVVVVAAFVGYLFLRPIGVDEAAGTADPAATYDDAIAKITAIQDRERSDATINPVCRSQLLGTGQPTDTVVVLFHGYTNCPAQYRVLAQELADRGDTVWVPLMPHHGELDREHTTLDRLTADDLAVYANGAVDIAAGLGDTVTVMGLSGGGMAAAYVAQTRDDVDLAIPLSAYLGIAAVPEALTPPLINLAELLPPIGIGTSSISGDATSGTYAPYAAFDNNTRSAAAFMELAQVTLAASRQHPHAAGRTILGINEADDTVNLPMLETLAARWDALAPETSEVCRFPASLGLPHDLIGPDRVDQHIDLVYPILLDLIADS